MTDHEQMVRERAFYIWLERGMPEGEHEAHWQQAEEELARRERPQRAERIPEKS